MLTSLKIACLSLILGASTAAIASAGEITVGTINNGHMLVMQELTKEFEKANPDIKVNWVTLDEGQLRQRITTDISTKGGEFDVMTIGMYEVPIWGAKDWLVPLKFSDAYDVNDIYPAIRDGLSVNGTLFAAPFYGESSMVMYNQELVKAAGFDGIKDRATWTEIREIAKKITNKEKGIYGICLRGKPGWGENMAFLGTMANSFGATYFTPDWKPAFDSQAWKDAVQFYVQRDPRFDERGPLRHVDRRHDRRLADDRPGPVKGGGQARLRAGAEFGHGEGLQLAVGLGPCGSEWHQELGRSAEVRGVGHFEGLHQARRHHEGLGLRPDRQPQVDL